MHFHEAQLQFKKIRGPTMKKAGHYHANALAQEMSTQLQQQLEQRDSQLLSVIQSFLSLIETSSSSDSLVTQLSDLSTQVANAITADNTQLEILKILQEVKSEFKSSNCRLRRSPNSDPFCETPDNQTKPKHWITKHYSWTYRALNYLSSKYRFKAEGHQDLATFENKMGSSKAYFS